MNFVFPRAATALAASLLTVSALAGEPGESDGEKQAKAEETEETKEAEVKDKDICKRIAPDMSSRRRTKVCMTRDEWKQWNAQQRARRH